MTEQDAQNLVAARVTQRRDICVVPNCGALGHEADLLRITENRMVSEYEIKLSRSDFLANRKKLHHQALTTGRYAGRSIATVCADIQAAGRTAWSYWWPNYFWFACLEGVCTADELPAKTGLLVISPAGAGWQVHEVRRAGRHHGLAVPDRVLDYALRGMVLRFWQERQGINPVREARDRQRRAVREYRERDRQERQAREAWLRDQDATGAD